ncbi:Serine/threonine-protein kinase haspin [Halocaridina rubra]|uniref:Serine/threonine-protein kinase haspin n=1 Tax=Halocaridina rubra TaxID=373956 RepID=A0AAN8XV23_HALRR
MGPRPKVKSTYSKAKQVAACEEKNLKSYKKRQCIPKFDKLFLPKDENNKDVGNGSLSDFLLDSSTKLMDDLRDLKNKRKCKRLRKPLAVNTFLANSSSKCSSGDSFDKLLKGTERQGIPISQYNTGVASSSSTSHDASSSILYLSLRSHDSSRLKSEVPKNENSLKIFDQLDIIHESVVRRTGNVPIKIRESQTSPVLVSPRSPLLFSSIDDGEDDQSVSGLCSKVISKKSFPEDRSGSIQNNRKREYKCLKIVNSDNSDLNMSCLDKQSKPELEWPVETENPLIAIKVPGSDDWSPELENKIVNTPNSANFVKALFHRNNILSQGSPSVPLSHRSEGSGKFSNKSEVLTSTPADTSRVMSVTSNGSSWNVKSDTSSRYILSPIPRDNDGINAGIKSPDQRSVLCNFDRVSSGSQKSHSVESHYETCVSERHRTNVAESTANSSGKDYDTEDNNCDKETKHEHTHSFYNSAFELSSGPFKGVSVPAFDPTGVVRKLSVNYNSSQSGSSNAAIERDYHNDEIVLATTRGSSTTVKNHGRCHGQPENYQNHFENISFDKVKEINSFLSKPSLVIPTVTRRKKCNYTKKKLASLAVRRLTRRTARLAKFSQQNKESQVMAVSFGISDQSTTSEPSIVLPRKKKTNTNRMSNVTHISDSTVNDSASIDRSVVLLRRFVNRCQTNVALREPFINLPRRASLRLANKRGRGDSKSNFCKKSYILESDDLSTHEILVRPQHSSSHACSRKLQGQREKMNIMLSSLSFNGTSSSNGTSEITRKDSLLFQNRRLNNSHQATEDSVEQDIKLHSNADMNSVKNGFIEEELSRAKNNESSLIYGKSSILKKVCDSALDCSVVNSANVCCRVIEGQELEDSVFDTTDGVFQLPFQKGVLAKQGKGWMRSLSLARASSIAGEQLTELSRRHTVDHITILKGTRRLTQLQILPLHEVTNSIVRDKGEIVHEAEDILSHSVLSDARRHVLTLCSQTEPLPLTECFTPGRLSCCKKIGEGVYGEVFMNKPIPSSMDDATVMKIMPIEGEFEVNGEPQKKFGEILSEIIISLELNNLRSKGVQGNGAQNFVHVLKCWCTEGSYHADMLHLWDLYHEEKGSENDRPDIFPDSQMYIVLEFSHGGRDLEGFVFNNAGQSLAVFLQIAYSLAVAEQALEFEHRDLHWGNVLVATTKESSLDFHINHGIYTVQTQGVKATIIDFTLSRLKAPHCVMYNNLAEDPSLFTAQGDYQFEIYRQMKKVNNSPRTLMEYLDKIERVDYFSKHAT